jgi:dolichol-phosphate mannosyltransferase
VSPTAASPELSLVIPAFNEAECLPALHAQVVGVLGDRHDWEMIVVDDGSTDTTREVVRRLHAQDRRVRGVHLLLNGGHMRALAAGIDHAEGRLVVTMDADLQHPPELIPAIVARWREGALIVHTVRREMAHEGLLKRLTSRVYYRVFRAITGIPILPGMADFRGLDRKVVRVVREYREDNLPLRFLLARLPFPSAVLEYEPARRFAGTTKYSFQKMLTFAAESLFSFSLAPLYVGYLLGLAFLALFMLYALYVLYVHIFLHAGIQGWSSQILITLVASAVQFTLIGILGGYVGAIHREVKHRPRYMVGERTGFDEPAAGDPADPRPPA